MKNTILYSIYLLLVSSLCYSQIPQDYPFKVIINETGNVFITGEISGDIFTSKYNSSLIPIWNNVYSNPGIDRGMDITVDSYSFVYVTGYISNQTTGKKNIFTIKYDNSSFGDTIWTKSFGDINFDDQAFGVTRDAFGDIYITGYITNKNSKKNIKILKYAWDNGNLIWQATYDNPQYYGDDIGTSILTDDNFVYVLGTTYNGPLYNGDIIQLTYNANTPYLEDSLTYQRKGIETPTSFVISQLSRSVTSKSRTSLTSMTDNQTNPSNKDFLILTFKGSEFIWGKKFSGPGNLDDVPTSCAVSDSGLFITGYSYSKPSNSDFATIKYKLYENGNYGWTDTAIRYFDYNGGKDKGSSVKIYSPDNSIYISGTSEHASNGFILRKYYQINGGGSIITRWERVHIPENIKQLQYQNMKRASVIEIDSLGFIYQINYMWDDTYNYYEIVKYDSDGNELFSVDNIEVHLERDNIEKNEKMSINDLMNYPNPFNPSTVISYKLSNEGFVSLKVFDMMGREIKNLVNEKQLSGSYNVNFDAANLTSGVYFYKLILNGIAQVTKQMFLIK